MDVNLTEISEIEHQVEISVSQDELQPHFETAYAEVQPKIELKGFRKGKVPLPIIKRMYGEAIEQDTLDKIANSFYRRAMEEKNVEPIGQPSMVDMDFKRGEHFRFKIQYEVRPKITLKQYKGIVVEKPIHTVTEEEIAKEVGHLRKINSTTSPAERVTSPDHIVTADVQELDETGAPLIGKRTRDAKFLLNDDTLAPEIREALTNVDTGAEVRVRFTTKHEQHEHTHHVSIKVTKIEKVNLPELNDELVKKITRDRIGTTDEFLADMRKDLERYWAQESDRKVEEAIVSEIVRLHDFPVPQSMVTALLDSFVEDVKGRSRDRKLPRGFDEAKFREETKAMAIFQGKWMLLKDAIARQEGITVDDADLESSASVEAERTGIQKDRLLEYYRKSEGATDRLLSAKLMSFLKGNAIITEKKNGW